MPENRSKYTLDELLRAKRSERPEPEFWVRFERELKTKQKLLIQRQLVSESRLKSPLSARLFKVGTFTATCGIAAVAVYLGFQTPVGETGIAQNKAELNQAVIAPSFTVAVAETQQAEPAMQEIGLKEFSTLARPSSPRVVVHKNAQVAKQPTQTQLKAIETLASLEKTIRGNRANSRSSASTYEFVSSSGLFESDLVQLEDQQEELIDGLWDFESAYLLGKYADPLTGTLPSNQTGGSISDIQHVSFSQIDDALSGGQGRRSSSRSIDALTVRF